MDNFSARLTEERIRLGLNQTDFGALGGVKKQAQFNYEKGERTPDAAYLASISKAGVDVLYVITGQRLPEVLPSGINRELLQKVVEQVERYHALHPIEPAKKAQLIVMAYEEFATRLAKDEKVDPEYVERLFKLAS